MADPQEQGPTPQRTSRPSGSGGLSRAQRLLAIRFSPLVFGLLLAIVWFSVPTGLWRTVLASTLHTPTATDSNTNSLPGTPTDAAKSYFEDSDAASLKVAAMLDRFRSVVSNSWRAGTAHTSDLFAAPDTVTVVPLAWPATSTALAPLDSFERQTGARVYAWVLQPIPEPSLVARAVFDESLLYSDSELESAQVSDDASMLWRTWHDPGQRQPIDWTGVPGHFIASQDASRDVGVSIVGKGLAWWLVYVIAPHTVSPKVDRTSLPVELAGIVPTSPSWVQTMNVVAMRRDADILALGPLRLDAVPLRIPAGAKLASASALGDTVWPNDQRLYLPRNTHRLSRLSATEASAAGGNWAAVQVAGMFGENRGSTQVYGDSIMYAAVFDKVPGATGGPTMDGWTSFLIAAAPELPFVLGTLIVVFLVSLLASMMTFLLAGEPQPPHSTR